MATFFLPAFIAFDTARACIAFGVIRAGVYLPPAKIALLSESCKLICALIFHFRWHRSAARSEVSRASWLSSLLPRSTEDGSVDYRICFYTALPAALYLINNVFYLVGLRFVSPALLNTTMLLKLPLTAILHFLIMRRARCQSAWVSLAILSLGVLSLHFPWEMIGDALWPSLDAVKPTELVEAQDQSWLALLGPLLGFIIAGISSVTAIATEVLLKKPMPFWSLQVWLYGWGAGFAALLVLGGVDRPTNEAHNPNAQMNESLGYMAVVLTTCATGLVVANILRKSDNLVKLVGSSATIVTTLLLQPLLDPSLWSETCNPTTVLAVGVIAMSTWTYNHFKDQLTGGKAIRLPLYTPLREKMLSQESIPLNGDRSEAYADNEDDVEFVQKMPLQAEILKHQDWLTPTRPKLVNFGLVVIVLATLTQLLAPPQAPHRAALYDPLANVAMSDWKMDRPNGTMCLEEWREAENMTAASSKFSDWDRHFLQQMHCPVWPIPEPGYVFHMLWLGQLNYHMQSVISLSIDAWLATQRLQDGHRLYFWHDQPTDLSERYANYTDFIEFRLFDRLQEAQGTCMATKREYWDTAYQEEIEIGSQTLSDMVRVLLLAKYGGFWMDTDTIPMRDYTPLMRMGPFAPSLHTWMWNNNVLFFGPPKSSTGAAVLATACAMPYEESLFHQQYEDISPPHWYWLYNDGLMQVCEKYTNCGMQRLSLTFFDGAIESWTGVGQTAITIDSEESDGHPLNAGQLVPVALRQLFAFHGRANQRPDAFSPEHANTLNVIRHRIDELLEMGPSMAGGALFDGPGLVE